MIAAGKHKARAVANPEMGTSKNKGTPFVHVEFALSDGSDTITWDGYFTDNTTERTIESLKHCGCTFPGNDITNFEGIDRNEVVLVVEHEDYEGQNGELKTAAKVKWVNSGRRGIAAEQKMDAGSKADFKSRMMGALIASKAGEEKAAMNGGGSKRMREPGEDDLPI